MASSKREKTEKVGVFYIMSTIKAKSKGQDGKAIAIDKPDKIYYIMYRLDGKKVEEKVGRESERMTPAKAAKIREQRIHRVSLPNTERRRLNKEKKALEDNKWTIAKLWENYKENKVTFKGIRTDENRFKNYLAPFHDSTPDEITTQSVDSLKTKLLKSGLKSGTVKNILELLRRLVNYGVKKGYCAWKDPSQLHFDMPKLNNVKTEMLTKDERARFLKVAEEYPNRKAANIMLIAYYTGMRRSEIFRLQWSHIDFENGFINIKGDEQEGAKSNRDERIPLSLKVREILQSIDVADSPYVFPGRGGKGHVTDIIKEVNKIKKLAKLPEDFRALHGMRHTFASVAVSKGVPLSHVQKLLTHKDPNLTQRYAHLEDEALKKAADSVSDFLSVED